MTTYATLITAPELAALPPAGVLVVDCRFDLADPMAAERLHAEGHLPGAVYAHLDRDLSDLSKRGQGRHPLPDAAAFSALLARWGWTPALQVVAYDAAGGALAAARLWWMLRLAGASRVAVLDGGIQAWTAAGLPLESGVPARAPTRVEARYDEARLAGFDVAARAKDDPAMLLLDARAAPRYRGEVEPIDPVGGHVPGARNRPFADNLDDGGRFKRAQTLRQEFAALLGARRPADVVHMCGSGVTACHNLLAMEHAGLAGSRLFAPSWSGWVGDPTRPVAQGDA
ncbi:MAG: sulfurtransferase [Mizugakiibacter sp.]|uniref:sulfurtransferase n=1 Tax=Mizugakiibacter sp. TaxID=1972610 RepID=UPI0031BBFC23|nr:sulfurtransferase [Xanthomonadaceae bacterium]